MGEQVKLGEFLVMLLKWKITIGALEEALTNALCRAVVFNQYIKY